MIVEILLGVGGFKLQRCGKMDRIVTAEQF